MSFENALVTKGLMIGIVTVSAATGIFNVQHHLHLQLVPHISKHHQYWRLLSHHIACANSSDVFLILLLLFNAGVHIERSFGSSKYASFLVVTTLVSTITTFLSLLALQVVPPAGVLFNRIPSGPISIVFAILYQYMRLVPQAYQMKVFGVVFSDKIWLYALAAQLFILHFPSGSIPVAVGLLSGYVYRSDILQLKSWRVPYRIRRFAESLAPLLGAEKAIRRTNRVLPEQRQNRRAQSSEAAEDSEVVTTARQHRAQTTSVSERPAERRATRADQRLSDIQTLTAMFPNVGRNVITDVMHRR
ncbi:uncharacterized protein FIBRA_03799 [Fibroporia radiculosa]|uniref:Peptidase S54 rhomboid domain-containing protein n=1 Tax=Fibroporia radiculosa TaxID=599839 RepID=J4G6C3_9APHY|nr:uncharacterized protein FIBRA_03799 [Fibroporia radiculosa]CCM01733.1 predicted protein [Fibroporia radiculosa]